MSTKRPCRPDGAAVRALVGRTAILAIAIVGCWLGLGATSAPAATIRSVDNSSGQWFWLYEAETGIGEEIVVQVKEVGGSYDFLETGGYGITGNYSICTRVSFREVTCPITDPVRGEQTVDIEGGPGSDSVDLRTTHDTFTSGGAGDDVLMGGSGRDSISGADGADFIDGRGGPDDMLGWDGGDTVSYASRSTPVTVSLDGVANDGGPGEGDSVGLPLPFDTDVENISGSQGGDTLTGSGSANTLRGNAGFDAIYGLGGNDTLQGGDTGDHLEGGDGNDTMSGENGSDTLRGDSGGDLIQGDADDDRLIAGPGADSMYGNAGTDEVEYGTYTVPVTVNVGDDQPQDGAAGEGDNAHSDIERVFGGSGDDHLSLGRPPSSRPRGELWGRAGNDTLTGGDNNDRLEGEDGNDVLDGSYSADVINGGAGVDTVDYSVHSYTDLGTGETFGSSVTPGNGSADDGNDQIDLDGDCGCALDNVAGDVENVLGSAGPDVVVGTPDANLLRGQGGNDELDGDYGNDTLDGGAGADTMNGSGNIDTVTYASRSAALRVSLDDLANDGEAGEGDNVEATVENVRGGSGPDVLIGSADPNTFLAGGGGDVLNGRLGGDVLDGQAGVDTLTYADRTNRVAVTIDGKRNDGADPNQDGKSTTAEEGDLDRSIENATGGSGNDILRATVANAVANLLRGGGGDDTIKTREGTATVDQLLCGPGAGDQYAKDPSDTENGCEVALP
jgi:Ca2+-binding RTX toxin-like protein